jgi:probable HAF family extracellular repeat protein
MFHGHMTPVAIVAAALAGLLAGVLLVGRPSTAPATSPEPSASAPVTVGSAQPSPTTSPTVAASARPLTERYTLTDLGVLGGLDSMAFGVAGGGNGEFGATFVVGHADTAPNSKWAGFHSFLWVENAGRMFDIGTLPGDVKSGANAVNAGGVVVGESIGNERTRAFVFDGTMHTLPGFGGVNSGASAVNAAGQVAGYSKTTSGADHAFVWKPAAGTFARGTLVDLGTLPGDIGSFAQGINARGQVVGYSNDSNYYSHALLWTPRAANSLQGTMTALGALPGETYASAYAINAAGTVVGEAQVGEAFHAFVWRPSTPNGTTGAMSDLGTLGGNWSRATAINGAGDIVGVAEGPAPDAFDHAFLYRDGTMYDLNTALPSTVHGVILTVAYGVADSGQIVGGATVNGHSHAFLLTPVS